MQGRLNLGGMTHFDRKLTDAATRCVLRPINVSKCACSRGSTPGPARWGHIYTKVI